MSAPLSVPTRDHTQRDALEHVERTERATSGRLMVSIEERCGERLIEAFLRCAGAYFTGRDAATGR